MNLEKIRELLPVGSYFRIAEKVGKAEGTVAQVFVERTRVSDETRDAILEEAALILEEWGREAILVAKEIKAAKAVA